MYSHIKWNKNILPWKQYILIYRVMNNIGTLTKLVHYILYKVSGVVTNSYFGLYEVGRRNSQTSRIESTHKPLPLSWKLHPTELQMKRIQLLNALADV